MNDLGEVHAVVAHSIGSFSLMYAFHEAPLLPVKKVILMAKSQQNSMADETGVRPSIKEEEMKSYVEKVMEEIKAAESTSSKVSTA